jgi:hypothetical protein
VWVDHHDLADELVGDETLERAEAQGLVGHLVDQRLRDRCPCGISLCELA